MTNFTAWQEANDAFIGASLHWLRLRLQRMASAKAGAGPGSFGAVARPLDSATTAEVEPGGSVTTPDNSNAATAPPAAPSPAGGRRLFGFAHRSRPGGPVTGSGGVAPTTTATSSAPAPSPAPARPAPAPQHETIGQAEIDAALAAVMAIEANMDPPPALARLVRRFDLSRFERDILFLCAALELDTRIAGWCAQAQDDARRTYPTFALAMALFDAPLWEALSPERPLRFWKLIEINQPGAQPLTSSALRADERIVNYLKGLNYLDDRLAPLVSEVPMPDDEATLAESQAAVVDTIVRYVAHAPSGTEFPVVQLVGPDGASKRLVAAHAGREIGIRLYRMAADALPVQTGEFEAFLRLWQRERLLLPIALYVDASELDRDGGEVHGAASLVRRFLARSRGLFFLDVRDAWPEVGRSTLVADVAKPTPIEQEIEWQRMLGDSAGDAPARLAAQFNCNLDDIRRTAVAESAVNAGLQGDAEALGKRLWQACLAGSRPRLDALAQLIDSRATRNDLVLPDAERALLDQIKAQVEQRRRVYDDWGFRAKMNRGLGISVLFDGAPGTGKTFAAGVIANELGLNLYRIDLSGVVSKWVGVTAQNLRRLFDAAEDGGTILFFDEADALFGTRSAVKDSHDRYANIEINYLLQRMEAYGGLAILATNMKSALDQAFFRRLTSIVTFPFPGPTERRKMWEHAFTAKSLGDPPVALDLDRLAKLNVTGGVIHNIALNAAFLAASAGTSVTMPLVLQAARTEFRKMERPIIEAEFAWTEPVPPAPADSVPEPANSVPEPAVLGVTE